MTPHHPIIRILYLVFQRVEVVVSKSTVGSQKVSFDALGWFHRHLGAVLKNEHREHSTRHTRQPQSEIFVHLKKRRKERPHCGFRPCLLVTHALGTFVRTHLNPEMQGIFLMCNCLAFWYRARELRSCVKEEVDLGSRPEQSPRFLTLGSGDSSVVRAPDS